MDHQRQYQKRDQFEARHGFVELDGVRIHFKTAGAGRSVLLLHGWGSRIESFDLLFQDLARFYALTAFDFPGHGLSDLPPGDWNTSDFADLTIRLMDALEIQRPSIVAHSFGGRVAISLAASHPERVAKVLLVDSAGVPPPSDLRRLTRRAAILAGKALSRLGRVGSLLREMLLARIASSDYLNAGPMRGTFVKVVRDDLRPLLNSIRAETLLVWGEFDTDTPVASGRAMERLIPHARLVVLKNAGHFSYIDQYNRFRLILLQFLGT